MQQDNSIIQKLQQLDNQQLPDLSQMDSHWQQMQAMLTPVPPQKTRKHWLWLLPAACLLMALVWWLASRSDTPSIPAPTLAAQNQTPVVKAVVTDTIPNTQWQTSGDTLQLLQRPRPSHHPKKVVVQNDTIIGRTDTQYFNINFIPCKDSSNMPTANLQQQWLNDFFNQVQKQPNHYIINNTKDTLLLCQEGTMLQIPAGSLGGYGRVEFMVKEIYTKSDMVLNRLSTTSNKALLESGGMLHLSARYNDQPVDIAPQQAIMVYMPDTSPRMQQMQLFTGEQTSYQSPNANTRFNEKMQDISGATTSYINWVPQYTYFYRPVKTQTVHVLDLMNEPQKVKERRKGQLAIFYQARNSNYSRSELKAMLEERNYGYDKIKVKRPWKKPLFGRNRAISNIGDSIWIRKEEADRLRLPYTSVKTTYGSDLNIAINDAKSIQTTRLVNLALDRYAVKLGRLGWINCDEFYNEPGPKLNYVVQLGDDAANYVTLLVFNDINAVAQGDGWGRQATFYNVPAGRSVTVISVGINNKGQSVYTLQKGVTGGAGLTLTNTYQPADAATLPQALSQINE